MGQPFLVVCQQSQPFHVLNHSQDSGIRLSASRGNRWINSRTVTAHFPDQLQQLVLPIRNRQSLSTSHRAFPPKVLVMNTYGLLRNTPCLSTVSQVFWRKNNCCSTKKGSPIFVRP